MSEWTLETLKQLFDERFAARDGALWLQAKEYERRLDDLNHAHEQAREDYVKFLPREEYRLQHTALQDAFEAYKESTSKALLLREGQTDGQQITMGRLVTAATLMLSLIVVVIVVANYLTSH